MNCGAAAARALRKLPSLRKLPLVDGVGTGCQPVPGHILHLGFCVKPGSRLAAGTYWARDLREAQQKSRRKFLFSMNGGAAAAEALRQLPLVEGVGTGCQPVPGHILHLGICVKSGSRLAAGTYQARDLQRCAAEESQTGSVLNALRRSRGRGSPKTSRLSR